MFQVSENLMAASALQDPGRLPLTTTAVAARIREALTELDQAQWYAADLRVDLWQFAIPVARLFALGLTENDIRWLELKECVEPRSADGEPRGTYVVMGKHGRELLWRLSAQQAPGSPPGVDSFIEHVPTRRMLESASEFWRRGGGRPRWDASRSELRLGGAIVKQFRLPAPNQRRVLTAFEEEHWPGRIDDPLLPHPEIDCKRRLHHTLIALNRNQKQRLIQFHGDGTGQGICWSERGRACLARFTEAGLE